MTLSNTLVNKKHYSVDLCKMFMALVVVSGHTRPFVNCSNPIVLAIYNQILYLAVPFFFLASGYMFSRKLSSFSDTKQNVNVTIAYLCRLTKMYLIWSLIYLPLAILAYWRDDLSLFHSILSYVQDLVLVGHHYNSWHLWYLLSSIYAYIFVLVMLRLQLNHKKWIITIGFVCLLSIFIDEISAYSKPLPAVLHAVRSLISRTIVSGRILRGAFFIPVGILMGNRNISLRKCLILFIGCFCVNFFIENELISNILTYVCGVALFGTLLHINLRDQYIYIVLRKLSTDVYLIHMYIWSIYCSLVYKKVHFGWDSFFVTSILSLAVGILHLRFTAKKKSAVS